MKKILLIIAAVIAVISIAIFLLIRFYITPERVKAFVIPTAEKSLNRKINIGDISINVFKGIGIKDFAIKEADNKTDFIKCKDFVLKFKLLPLLSKKVIIDELRLVSPEIRIMRDKKGKYNFEDIGQKREPEEVKKRKRADEEEGLPISLLVNKVVIDNAKFSFTDLKGDLPDVKSSVDIDLNVESVDGANLSTQGYVDLKLNKIVIKKPTKKQIKNITAKLKYAVYLNMKSNDIRIEKADLKVQEIPLSITGDVKNFKKSPEINLAISLPKVRTADLQEILTSFTDIRGLSLSGNLAADVKLKGMPQKFESLKADSTIALDKIGIKYDKIDTVLDGNLKFNFKSDNVQIKKANLKFQEVPASITGSVKNFKTSPEIDISVSVPRTGTGNIQKLLVPIADIKGLALSGNLTADLRFIGQPKKLETLKTKGKVLLEKVGVVYNNINAVIDGNLKFSKQSININLKSTIGKNSADLKGSVSNYFKNQNINLNIYSKQLFIDELIPIGKTNDSPPVKSGKLTIPKAPKEAEAVDLKLTAKGDVKIDSAVYKGMTMSNFYMKYQFRNNKLEISKMTANAGKGKFDLNSLIDLSKPGYKYNLTATVDSLHAEEIVNSFFPKAKDTIFGTITSNLKLSGTGTLPENIKKNLAGNGDFNIKDGKITNTKIAENLSLLLDLSELETIILKKANGTVKIRNGIARLDSIFSSDDLSMDPKGNIGLDETLDLAFDLKLSPRLTNKAMGSKISQYIRDKGGWGTIPLLVTGTLSNPKYTVDVAKVGKKVIEKEVNKFLEKLLNKDRDEEQPQQPQKEEGRTRKPEPVNPLEDLLKQLPGLFEK